VLADLDRQGHRIHPSPTVMATIQDKYLQRDFFRERGFPVPSYVASDRPVAEDARRIGFPVVQKARRGGYDGRGVEIMREEADLKKLMDVPSVFEQCVPVETELSVIVARSVAGETRCYAPVEMIFDPQLNLVDGLIFPARVDPDVARNAESLALRAVEALGGVGIFAVELFVERDGTLWLNEIAPRPHNSGHVTIEAAVTCQFEQHLRAVLGMPLGDCSLIRPAAMVNVTGPPGSEGVTEIPGLALALEVPGARLHMYGKSRLRPGRKMGHITVLDDDVDQALERARLARRLRALRAREAA